MSELANNDIQELAKMIYTNIEFYKEKGLDRDAICGNVEQVSEFKILPSKVYVITYKEISNE